MDQVKCIKNEECIIIVQERYMNDRRKKY